MVMDVVEEEKKEEEFEEVKGVPVEEEKKQYVNNLESSLQSQSFQALTEEQELESQNHAIYCRLWRVKCDN